jgi:Xaa-Pro aminopeptidase
MNDRARARVAAVQRALHEQGAEFLLVPASADFVWLTGAHARVSERLLCLVVPRSGAPVCLVPKLETDALAAECPWLERMAWDDDRDPWPLLAGRLGLERRPALSLAEGFRVGPVLALA